MFLKNGPLPTHSAGDGHGGTTIMRKEQTVRAERERPRGHFSPLPIIVRGGETSRRLRKTRPQHLGIAYEKSPKRVSPDQEDGSQPLVSVAPETCSPRGIECDPD